MKPEEIENLCKQWQSKINERHVDFLELKASFMRALLPMIEVHLINQARVADTLDRLLACSQQYQQCSVEDNQESIPLLNPNGIRLRPACYDRKMDNGLTSVIGLGDIADYAFKRSNLADVKSWNALNDEQREEFLLLAERELNVFIPEDAQNSPTEPFGPVEVPDDQPEILSAVELSGEADDGIPAHLEGLLPTDEDSIRPDDQFLGTWPSR